MYTHSNNSEQRRPNLSGRTRFVATLIAVMMIVLLAAGVAGAADNSEPPTPRFASPLNGWVVEGMVPVRFYAPQQSQWAAEFGVDGAGWQPMTTTGNGVFYTKWDSAHVAGGWHTLTVRLSYGPGRPPVIAVSIEVFVDNEMPGGQAGGELPGRPNSVASHVCLPVTTAFSIANPPYCGYPGA